MQGEVGFAGQLTVDEIKALADQGVKTFVCNRPDDEEQGQPKAKALQQAAEQMGVKFFMLPLATGTPPSQALLQQYAEIYKQAPKPLIAFCRSGRRSSVIHNSARQFIEENDN